MIIRRNANIYIIILYKQLKTFLWVIFSHFFHRSKRNVKYFQCDLINKEDIHKVFQDLKSGDVDILVNAAGIYSSIHPSIYQSLIYLFIYPCSPILLIIHSSFDSSFQPAKNNLPNHSVIILQVDYQSTRLKICLMMFGMKI